MLDQERHGPAGERPEECRAAVDLDPVGVAEPPAHAATLDPQVDRGAWHPARSLRPAVGVGQGALCEPWVGLRRAVGHEPWPANLT